MPSLVSFPAYTLQSLKIKSRKILKSETERLTQKIDKIRVPSKGYDKIRTRIFPKSLINMFPSSMISYDERPTHFKPELGSVKKTKSPNRKPVVVPSENGPKLCPSVLMTYQNRIFNENEHFTRQNESFV